MPERLAIGCAIGSCARIAASSAARAMASGKTITVSACVRVMMGLLAQGCALRRVRMVTVYPSNRATAGLILAHGAGGGQTSSFIVRAGEELAARGIVVATFDFPYITAGRSAPDKPAVLEAHWRRIIDDVRARAEFQR